MTINEKTYGDLLIELIELQPKTIETEGECDRALAVIEKFMADKNRTPEQVEILKLLVTVVENYESVHYPMGSIQ